MTSAGTVTSVERRWASTVGVLPSPMSMARHPAETGPVEEGQPAGRFGLVAAELADEAVGVSIGAGGSVVRPGAGRRPTRCRPPDRPAEGASLEPDGVAEDRAPVSWLIAARSARAEAAAARSARSICTHRPRTWTSGVASLTSGRDPGRVELQVVEDTDQLHVGQLLHADLGRARPLR